MAKLLSGMNSLLPMGLALGLSACGTEDTHHATQVVARVNDAEITVHQLDYLLARKEDMDAKTGMDFSRNALDVLIEQELLVQQARSGGLERDPKVMLAIEDAKRRVLALAYLERNVLPKVKPTPEDIKAFYERRPELFAKRRIYRFQAFSLATKHFTGELRETLNPVQNPQETANILSARNIPYQSEWLQWSAEQAPLELLPQLTGMKPGDIAAINRGDNTLLIQLESTLPVPVNEEKAKPAIEAYLVNARNEEASQKKLKSLKSAAEISYLGTFAGYKPDQVEPPPAEQKDLTSSSGTHLQKGIDGL